MEIYLRCKVLMDVDRVTQWIDLKVGNSVGVLFDGSMAG